MTGQCAATFIGGPVDGLERAFPGDVPPATFEVATYGSTPLNPTMREVRHSYARAVNPGDGGTAWVLTYEGCQVLP